MRTILGKAGILDVFSMCLRFFGVCFHSCLSCLAWVFLSGSIGYGNTVSSHSFGKGEKWLLGVGAEYSFISGFSCSRGVEEHEYIYISL